MLLTEIVKDSLDYIELNLKTDIKSDELAGRAGYSQWHYCRLFAKETGMSVAAYIGKRRLDKALDEIKGGRSAIDVALEYGFDTYAGFYKAFRRMYGNSPKNYLSKKEISMYTELELREILANWNIPQDLPIIDVYVMGGAELSENVWSIGERYILKAEKRESLLKNLQVAKALADQGVAASTPVLTKDDAEYLENGDIIIALTKGLNGSPLTNEVRFGEKRRELGYKYGESIAKLHKVLAVIEPEIELHEQNQYRTVIEWAMPETKKQNIQYRMNLPDSFFEDYAENFGNLYEKLPKQMIHRDPNPSNILFDNGEVSGFIDFDLSNDSARLFDPCYCATGLLSEWRGVEDIHDKWLDVLAGILKGYDSVNPLTEEEKQSVYYMICTIQMIFTAYCEPQNELKELARTNREMLMYIVENRKRISSVLFS